MVLDKMHEECGVFGVFSKKKIDTCPSCYITTKVISDLSDFEQCSNNIRGCFAWQQEV